MAGLYTSLGPYVSGAPEIISPDSDCESFNLQNTLDHNEIVTRFHLPSVS